MVHYPPERRYVCCQNFAAIFQGGNIFYDARKLSQLEISNSPTAETSSKLRQAIKARVLSRLITQPFSEVPLFIMANIGTYERHSHHEEAGRFETPPLHLLRPSRSLRLDFSYFVLPSALLRHASCASW